MSQKSYTCDSCAKIILPALPHVHCQVCHDYDSCADCHVLELVSDLHSAQHDYEVVVHGHRAIVKYADHSPSQVIVAAAEVTAPQSKAILSPAEYWGLLLTPVNSPSPTFSRLIAAIFASAIAPMSTAWLEPSKYCALMLAAGYTQQEFPAVIHGLGKLADSPSLVGLQALDA